MYCRIKSYLRMGSRNGSVCNLFYVGIKIERSILYAVILEF